MKNPRPPQYTLPETVVKTPHSPTQDTMAQERHGEGSGRPWESEGKLRTGGAPNAGPSRPSPLAAIIARNEGESRSHYRFRTKLNVKVLDFVQCGGFYKPLILKSG